MEEYCLGGTMDKTLLIGNGLNRTLKDGFSGCAGKVGVSRPAEMLA